MKKIVSMLLAAVLSMGMLAGCGGQMSEEEKAYKESCKPYTYDELMELPMDKLMAVQITGTVNGHEKDVDGKPMLYIEDESGNFIEIYTEEADLCHPNKNGHRKASKNGMNRILSFVFERRPHLFHGSLAGDLCRHDIPAKGRSQPGGRFASAQAYHICSSLSSDFRGINAE